MHIKHPLSDSPRYGATPGEQYWCSVCDCYFWIGSLIKITETNTAHRVTETTAALARLQ